MLSKIAPVGLGDPVFNKLHATLGQAMLSINAVKGFEYGLGFGATELKGSQHNDEFYMDGERVRTKTNRSGVYKVEFQTEKISTLTWPLNPSLPF